MIFSVCYRLLTWLMLPLMFLHLLWRSRHQPAYLEHISERLGHLPLRPTWPVIWIHAVSVGETLAAIALIRLLRQHFTDYTIHLTHTTPTGRACAQRLLDKEIADKKLSISYMPFDLQGVMRSFIQQLCPSLCIIMETEVWPHMLQELNRAHVPVLLANARLSQKSLKRYLAAQRLFQKVWPCFNYIIAQSPLDYANFLRLGINIKQLKQAPSLKYHIVKPLDYEAKLSRWQNLLKRYRFWMTASTHPGEEVELLSVFQQLKKHYPELKWILAPRHPVRAKEIEKLIADSPWTVVKRSALDLDNQSTSLEGENFDILLVDSLGELLYFYPLADVVFMGGSLVEKGGHNFLEPASTQTAITTGPSLFNFAALAECFTSAHALAIAKDQDELSTLTLHLLAQADERLALAQRAYQTWQAQNNNLSLYIELISQFLKN